MSSSSGGGNKTTRSIIAGIGTVILFLTFFAGYAAGVRGWWIAFLPLAIGYVIIYKLVTV